MSLIDCTDGLEAHVNGVNLGVDSYAGLGILMIFFRILLDWKSSKSTFLRGQPSNREEARINLQACPMTLLIDLHKRYDGTTKQAGVAVDFVFNMNDSWLT